MKTYEETIEYMQEQMLDLEDGYDYRTIRIIATIYEKTFFQVEDDLENKTF